MVVEDIEIKQFNNRYVLVHKLGYTVMMVDLVRDNQYFLDAKVLHTIAKALSLRWQQKSTTKSSKAASFGYSGLNVVQVERNGYAIFLPNGQQVAIVYYPLDSNYLDDDVVNKIICKNLALRYQIK